MHRERPARLPGATVWTRRAEPDERDHRVLPDGCLDLLWSDGELLVAGPDTAAHLGSSPAGATFTGLRFAPGTGPAVLGVPADALTDRRIPLDRIWPRGYVRELAERLAESDRPGRLLESVAMRRLDEADPPDPTVLAIAEAVAAGRSVAETADLVGYSERQLRRRCLPAFGYGPKTLARVLRMGRALDLARSGSSLAVAAVRAGYADQAHPTNEVRALAGVPPRVLLRAGPGQDNGAKRSTPSPSGSRITA